MICEVVAEGRGLFAHCQRSGKADWLETHWVGLYLQGTGSGRSYHHCLPSGNLKDKMNVQIFEMFF